MVEVGNDGNPLTARKARPGHDSRNTHTSISTTDADSLLTLYRDLLGLQQLYDITWETGTQPALDGVVGMTDTAGRAIALQAGNAYIEIFEYSRPTPRPANTQPAWDAGIRHICFDVLDIDGEYQRLTAAGIASTAHHSNSKA